MSKPQRGKGGFKDFFFFEKRGAYILRGYITGIEKVIQNKILSAFTGF